MKTITSRLAGLVAVTALLLPGVTACSSINWATTPASIGTSDSTSGKAPARSAATRIAFIAQKTSLRYASSDGPNFQIRLASTCPTCVVETYFAATQYEQNEQAAKALAAGADVLVVAPKDSAGASVIAQQAANAGAKVVSYDSLITGAPVDAYITFDGSEVGAIGAQAILSSTPPAGAVVVELDGDEANSNSAWIATGAHTALDGKIPVVYQQFVPDWSADNAYAAMTRALARLDGRPLAGVIGANDDIAKGAARALRQAGYTGTLPVISGQDADVSALQRLLTGDQGVTAYKSFPALASAAADMALSLAKGGAGTPGSPAAAESGPSSSSTSTTTTENGSGKVPTTLLRPVPVTAGTIASTVLKDRFTTVAALCAGAASQSCTQARITAP